MGGCSTLGCPRRGEETTPQAAPTRQRGREDFLSRWDVDESERDLANRYDPSFLQSAWEHFDGVHFSCAALLGVLPGGVAWAEYGFDGDLGALIAGGILFFAFLAAYLKDRLWLGLGNLRSLRHGSRDWWT